MIGVFSSNSNYGIFSFTIVRYIPLSARADARRHAFKGEFNIKNSHLEGGQRVLFFKIRIAVCSACFH